MDFESDVVNDDIQFQTQIDNTGKSQLPPTTWMKQSKRAYNQSKLVDFWSSEQNANTLVWDELSDQLDESDENKRFIKEYGIEATQQEKTAIEQTYNDGDWAYESGGIIIKTPKGKDMVNSIFGNNFNKMKGYAMSLPYDDLAPKSINAKVTEQTQDEYKRLGGLLEQDDWNEEFGSQFVGGAAAYLTDPLGVATLAAEVAILSKFRVLKGGIDLLRTKGKVRGVEELVTSGKSMDEIATFIAKSKRGFGREELMALGMSEAAAGSVSEALQQYLAYDFKSTVVPEHSGGDVSQAIGTVAGISMLIPMAGKFIGDKLVQGQINKQMEDGKKAQEEVDAYFEKETDEVEVEPTQTEKDIEGAGTLEEADVKKQEAMDAIDKIKECFMNESRGGTPIEGPATLTSHSGVGPDLRVPKQIRQLDKRALREWYKQNPPASKFELRQNQRFGTTGPKG